MHDMDLVLRQEEIVWFQKSRTKWIQDGDRTKYYHLKAINRKKRNKILMLRDIQGKWIDDKVQIRDKISLHFQDLFLRIVMRCL